MRSLTTSISVGLFILLALAPPLYLLVDALIVEGELSLDNYRAVLLDGRQRELLYHSIFVGGLTSLFTFLVGVPFGFILARVNLRCKMLFRCLYLVPVMLPTYIVGITWTEHFDLYGLFGTVFLLSMCYWPVIALFAEKGFRSISLEMEDAARVTSGPWRTFFTISLRLALPSILAGELFVFILSVGDFGIPDFLSFTSTKNYEVYTLEIFNCWSVLENTGRAVASSLPIIFLAILAVWGIHLLEGKRGYASVRGSFRVVPERPAGSMAFSVYLFMVLVVAASTLLPLTTLILWINKAGGFAEISHVIQEAFSSAGGDTLNTIISAALAAGLITMVGFFIAYQIERSRGLLSRILAFTALLPLAFPPVMLAVADIRIWNHPGNPFSDWVYGTRTELIMVYFARFVPIAIFSLRAALRQVDPNLEEASYTSGKGYLPTMTRILGPLIWGGLCAAFFLAYILCMRELDSVTLISAGNDTLPQRIYAQVHTSRDVGIGALSIMLVVTLLVPPAIYRLLVKGRIDVL